jgi:hypothetical protein
MMIPAPSSDEAQQALYAVRQQQAGLVRRMLAPLPAWYYLAGATLVILNGLAWDLSGPARWAVIAVAAAALIALTRAQRRRAGAKARYTWWYGQFDDRTFWIFFLYIAALVLLQQTMTTIFTRTGLPWPNTLGGIATAAALLIAAPLVRAVLRQRLTAHAQSGSDDTLHGLAYVLSLLPAAELSERLTGSSPARRQAGGTNPDQP